MSPYSVGPHGSGAPPRRLRDDLAAVEIEGDIVVYDPIAPACHVLSGGSVLVWISLEGLTTDGVVDRVKNQIGQSEPGIDAEILAVVEQFEELNLLEASG